MSQPDRTPNAASPRGNEPLPNYGLKDNYPEMWGASKQYDFAERLGGCSSRLLAEIDAALRELWDARRYAAHDRKLWLALECAADLLGNDGYADDPDYAGEWKQITEALTDA